MGGIFMMGFQMKHLRCLGKISSNISPHFYHISKKCPIRMITILRTTTAFTLTHHQAYFRRKSPINSALLEQEDNCIPS